MICRQWPAISAMRSDGQAQNVSYRPLHCPVQSAQYGEMSSSKRERGSRSPRALRALGLPVPDGWDEASKGLSLGLCRDGQNNVLNCSTDLKSKSGCDVQTHWLGNGLTSGVQWGELIEFIASDFLSAINGVESTGHGVGYRSRQSIRSCIRTLVELSVVGFPSK